MKTAEAPGLGERTKENRETPGIKQEEPNGEEKKAIVICDLCFPNPWFREVPDPRSPDRMMMSIALTETWGREERKLGPATRAGNCNSTGNERALESQENYCASPNADTRPSTSSTQRLMPTHDFDRPGVGFNNATLSLLIILLTAPIDIHPRQCTESIATQLSSIYVSGSPDRCQVVIATFQDQLIAP
ncbi:hypothetical protein ASPVEDRAFT_806324 [Aspergillus versicolor CBS 583.65]|uniref:Uncharacterized protein n=1 Tax=Aspergillus versicolor CBS 583.65 TaxID=1036611 RepID=A0A1L9PT34_ASPVE|nr:uncharacterized protein ASPVEDRAFT_806324 [Aspergillus versicolor CBS 583.65]OJJ04653.1 hypothetical protein ASPVEDRAFT_806324 [Aspergillus versicolor CBS 583.65]